MRAQAFFIIIIAIVCSMFVDWEGRFGSGLVAPK